MRNRNFDPSTVKRKKRLFIFGVSSFLGYNLALRFRHEYTVIGVYFTNPVFIPGCHIFPLSLQKIDIVDRLIMLLNPDYVINAMGLSDPRACVENENLADTLNSLMPLSLAKASIRAHARFIQLSTAMVYDPAGKDRKENNRNFSATNFGKSKLAGENYIRAQTMESTVLRVGKIVGLGNPHRLNDFDKLRMALSLDIDVEADEKLTYSYISLFNFLNAVEEILKGKFTNTHRTFNVGGPAMNELYMKKKAAGIMGFDESVVKQKTYQQKKAAAGESDEEEEEELMPSGGSQMAPIVVERNYTINSDSFSQRFENWKPEIEDEFFYNIQRGLNVGYSDRPLNPDSGDTTLPLTTL